MTPVKKYLILTSLLAVLGAGGWISSKPRPEVDPPESPKELEAVEDDGLPAREVAEKFTKATTQAQRLKWVRHPERVAAAMEDFFKVGKGAGETVVRLDAISPGRAADETYERFAAAFADGSRRLLCLVPTGGGLRVDFECYSRHGSAGWAELLDGSTAEAAEMRVFIEKGDYYNFGFKHEVRWQCFTASSPDLGDHPVWLYLPRTDPAIRSLDRPDIKGPVRVTLAIRSVGDSHARRQFEIARVHATDWVIPD